MTPSRKVVISGLAAVCVLGVLGVYLLATSDHLPSYAPQLRLCTRIEIEYQPSALENFQILAKHPGLLNPDEREYLRSLKTSVIGQREGIESVADFLSSRKSYPVRSMREPGRAYLEIQGYRDAERMVSFRIYFGRLLVTDDGQVFDLLTWPEVPSSLPDLSLFHARSGCAYRLAQFAMTLNCGRGRAQTYLAASEWCETIWPLGIPISPRRLDRLSPERIRRIKRQRATEAEQRGQYRCPGAGAGRCHYAMNPDCGPNSPPDTVLIFEANAGWNQHGGPELFTFDHHDPRGGCVLLNNGTVKFIRTEEELHQLRWK
jgi:hypothetical protein